MVNAGFAENVITWHCRHMDTPLRFFWDKYPDKPVTHIDGTLDFYRLDDTEFLHQMAGCRAYATTAGFESVCEAMYLGKPILMVPAHIEQTCNAHDAALNGAGIADESFELSRLLDFADTYTPPQGFREWVHQAEYRIVGEIETVCSRRRDESLLAPLIRMVTGITHPSQWAI